jgi:hypothetical protein
MSLRKLKEAGYSVLGGGTRAMGAPGEGEITLIRLPEVAKPTALDREAP